MPLCNVVTVVWEDDDNRNATCCDGEPSHYLIMPASHPLPRRRCVMKTLTDVRRYFLVCSTHATMLQRAGFTLEAIP